ncbi:MAG: AbrB/MazE/SpoVT family DNA-binding domain-containing protein [Micropruina sp.]
MPSATVTSKGQVTIPAEVRRRLGVHPGSRLAFVLTEAGHYEVHVESRTVSDLKGMVPRAGAPVTLEEMDRAVSEGATL